MCLKILWGSFKAKAILLVQNGRSHIHVNCGLVKERSTSLSICCEVLDATVNVDSGWRERTPKGLAPL